MALCYYPWYSASPEGQDLLNKRQTRNGCPMPSGMIMNTRMLSLLPLHLWLTLKLAHSLLMTMEIRSMIDGNILISEDLLTFSHLTNTDTAYHEYRRAYS